MDRRVKARFGTFVILFLLMLATACSGGSSYSVMNPRTQHMMMDGLEMRYTKMNGKRGEVIFAVGQQNPSLDVQIVTESGSISVAVAKEDAKDVAIQRFDNVQTSQFTISLPGPGEYYVWVEAKDHRGSYWIQLAH